MHYLNCTLTLPPNCYEADVQMAFSASQQAERLPLLQWCLQVLQALPHAQLPPSFQTTK
jgi:hypothetical protein